MKRIQKEGEKGKAQASPEVRVRSRSLTAAAPGCRPAGSPPAAPPGPGCPAGGGTRGAGAGEAVRYARGTQAGGQRLPRAAVTQVQQGRARPPRSHPQHPVQAGLDGHHGRNLLGPRPRAAAGVEAGQEAAVLGHDVAARAQLRGRERLEAQPRHRAAGGGGRAPLQALHILRKVLDLEEGGGRRRGSGGGMAGRRARQRLSGGGGTQQHGPALPSPAAARSRPPPWLKGTPPCSRSSRGSTTPAVPPPRSTTPAVPPPPAAVPFWRSLRGRRGRA